MRKKQFKAESKKLLDMMINSIYTHKEIFLRELISNASDALDKQYYNSFGKDTGMVREDYTIRIEPNKADRTLAIIDNGCGMTAEELETNLGTIAKSGSLDFKNENENEEKKTDIEIIGQFGVGFYSAFMVSKRVVVESRASGADQANRWISDGVEGYSIEKCDSPADHGTVITLYLKDDTEDEKYSEFLEEYEITNLVKKYSDYIRYPIVMNCENRVPKEKAEGEEDKPTEYETVYEDRQLNSMVPIWRKNKNEVTEEEYNNFYSEKFYDFEAPLKVIHSKNEGVPTYDSLIYIPSRAPFNYYSKDYEKGLALYSNGVMITEKCAELLPDYFNFARGLVDSPDLSLNISRELLQHDRQLKVIAKNIERKIKTELEKMLKDDRENYIKFFEAFGVQLKAGIYTSYGMAKETLQNLLIFKSTNDGEYVTLSEYKDRMPESQKGIYYACGETVSKIEMLPQTEAVKAAGMEVLMLTNDIDEFTFKMMRDFDGKEFINICTDGLDIGTEEDKKAVLEKNESSKELLDFIKESLGDKVTAVRFSNRLGNHPVTLTSGSDISTEMEKVINSQHFGEKIKAQLTLEINSDHKIAEKLTALYGSDKDSVAKYAKLLYNSACLISGIDIENPGEFSDLVCDLIV
ncbi:MAG: molecular chaperone HtpG [Clostridia bacterium]|nr:molecular chaperone HtpG [Clostridia bacterium]